MKSAAEFLEEALELECAAILSDSDDERLAFLRAAERCLVQALAQLSGDGATPDQAGDRPAH